MEFGNITLNRTIAQYPSKAVRRDGKKELVNLNIHSLDEKYIPYLQDFQNKVHSRSIDLGSDTFSVNKDFQHNILNGALFDTINSLKLKRTFDKFDSKHNKMSPILLMAECEGECCGLLVGNLPRVNLKTTQISYSSRFKPDEIELEYLGAFSTTKHEKVSATAPSLLAEFFEFCKKVPNKCSSIYVKAAQSEESKKAISFYENNGFEKIGKPTSYFEKNKPVKLVELLIDWTKCKPLDTKSTPMVVPIKKALDTAKDIKQKLLSQNA